MPGKKSSDSLENGRRRRARERPVTRNERRRNKRIFASSSKFFWFLRPPARVIKVSAFELAYRTINPPLAEADNTDDFLRKAFRDETAYRLLEQLVSEGKIRRDVNGKETRFCIHDK